MTRIAVTICLMTLLTGCALPVPLQIAGWVLDGASVLATDKTVADHGLSLVAGKDCSIWRGIMDGEMCRDERGNILVAAALSLAPSSATRSRVMVARRTETAASPWHRPLIAGPYLTVK